jgi:YggT family protein
MQIIIVAINYIIQAFSILILVEVIASWILAARVQLPNWGYEILRVVHTLTSPLLDPIRRMMPNIGLDFSPLIALLLLQVLQQVINQALRGLY